MSETLKELEDRLEREDEAVRFLLDRLVGWGDNIDHEKVRLAVREIYEIMKPHEVTLDAE